jgi:hypothetical protein
MQPDCCRQPVKNAVNKQALNKQQFQSPVRLAGSLIQIIYELAFPVFK